MSYTHPTTILLQDFQPYLNIYHSLVSKANDWDYTFRTDSSTTHCDVDSFIPEYLFHLYNTQLSSLPEVFTDQWKSSDLACFKKTVLLFASYQSEEFKDFFSAYLPSLQINLF